MGWLFLWPAEDNAALQQAVRVIDLNWKPCEWVRAIRMLGY